MPQAASRSRGARLAAEPDPRDEVDVDDRRAEVEQRRDHEVGEEDRDAHRRVGLAREQEAEREPREAEEQRERRERAGGVDVVGTAELDRPPERADEADALRHHGGHGVTGDPEPEHGGDREPREQGRRRAGT